MGVKKFGANKSIMKTLNSLGKTSTKVFIIGDGDAEAQKLKNATPITINDQRLEDVFFTFFLNEDSAYAMIARECWGETQSCFHSSDHYLVDGIITKMQKDYSLQEQI